MSTGASQQDASEGTGGAGPEHTNGVAPLAADRPYVDGTTLSPEQLRAEVQRLSNEELQHVDDLREEVGESLAELASRFDVKARVAGRTDEALSTVAQKVDHARQAAVDGVATARETAAEKPGLAVGAVVAALLVLLAVLLRRRRRG